MMNDAGESTEAPPGKKKISQARRFLEEKRRDFKKHGAKISPEDREKLQAAINGLEDAIEGRGETKRLSTALKELDMRVEQILGFAKKSTAREYAESIVIAILIAVVLRAFVVEAFKIPTGSMIPTLAVGDHIFVNKFIYGLRIPLTNSWFAEWGTPEHGDVIVFRFPRDLSKDYIKRVVAVAGDRVRVEGEEVFVNDKKLERGESSKYEYINEGDDEEYALGELFHALAFTEKNSGDNPHSYTVIYKRADPGRLGLPNSTSGLNPPGLECTPARPEAHGECKVEADYVFVMGDNRDNSSDSRVWGAVPTAYVKGKAMFVWWSRGPRTGVRWDRIGGVVR